MSEQNHPTAASSGLETIQDIRRIMERSSRFLSLSGLSGIAAGVCALAGAWFAKIQLEDYYNLFKSQGYSGLEFQQLKFDLLILAGAVLAAALVVSFYFTWRKAKQDKMPVWDHTSRRLTVNMMIPLAAGGLFILSMLLKYNEWRFVAPSCLIFYGIALVNASKYTVHDVRYLGLLQIILGLVNTQFVGYGLYFWAMGFGVLHIIYGFTMWWKYERVQKV